VGNKQRSVPAISDARRLACRLVALPEPAMRQMALADELRRQSTPESPWAAWCGSDESGKGDFLGPLCVAAVGVTRESAAELTVLGVRDCKAMTDESVKRVDEAIRGKHPFKLVGWMPEEYNQRYEKAGDLNRLLALAHGEAIEEVRMKLPIEAAVVDQFAHKSVLLRALRHPLTIVQRPKADETDVAVAAASVVARAAFVRGLQVLEREHGVPLPKGAGPETIEAARAFAAKHGGEKLRLLAKIHFKSMQGLRGHGV
jgi:ribonuclease HIII